MNIDNIYGRQVRLLVRLLPIIDAPVIRRSVFPAVRMEVHKIVEQHFGYAEIQLASPFETEFAEMTQIEIRIDELEAVRQHLIELINQSLTLHEKEFLLSFKAKHPKWELLGIKNADHIPQLPSVRWKMINLERLENSKHSVLYKKLESVLSRPS